MSGRPQGVKSKVNRTDKGKAKNVVSGKVDELFPLSLCRTTTKAQRDLWYEYIDRYHYLGCKLPFGAQLRYFIKSRQGTVLGCLQFSSPAWKMAPRDKWIGWSDEQRQQNLQKIISNSRFLILPWVKVKNLASSILGMAVRTVPNDWQIQYGYRPVVMETLVDRSQFAGVCYKAANWIKVGSTTGRGRMDRNHRKHGLRPKDIYVYALASRFREELAKL